MSDSKAFPDRFIASTVSSDTSFADALKVMTYDVAAVLADTEIIGTVTRTQIKHALRCQTHTDDAAVSEVMEPYELLDPDVTDRDDQLRDVFYVFLYALIKRQVEHKVFNPSNRDGCLNIVFEHVRSRLNAGKYEACSHRMTFSHWVRTVANNKVIDELRKLPSSDSVDAYRDSVRRSSKVTRTNPVNAINQTDVMKILYDAIEQLPEKQRLALTYSIQKPDLPGQQMAELLGMTVNAFHLNLNRARDKLQKILTETAPETVHIVKQLRNKPRKDD